MIYFLQYLTLYFFTWNIHKSTTLLLAVYITFECKSCYVFQESNIFIGKKAPWPTLRGGQELRAKLKNPVGFSSFLRNGWGSPFKSQNWTLSESSSTGVLNRYKGTDTVSCGLRIPTTFDSCVRSWFTFMVYFKMAWTFITVSWHQVPENRAGDLNAVCEGSV